ncbi:YqiA/YcfP family alpha/beta fold hydrolase [Undibacterium sp. Rencai35W]|uniref:YqiA/YcfP family alpha/beta fold hydrolase n=1 Tax=Undibacterium sp. Rencai35W TaxID=3413046 RepID=UPI003BF14966
MILYLHGFRSSPQSFKARMMAEHMQRLGRADDYVCPQLSASPLLAIQQAEQILAAYLPSEITIIGSSLGGFYATWLAERYGCKAVLLNPAVKPPRDLEKYVGVTTAYHSDEIFEFKAEYVPELRACEVVAITQPERYLLLAATGDEVLDWREMVAHYPGAQQIVIQGSDHGMADFVDYIDQVIVFCDEKA